jgi:hypothetical protein
VCIKDDIAGEKVPWRPYAGVEEREVEEEGTDVNCTS